MSTKAIEALRRIDDLLTDLQPKIPDSCQPGREVFIDCYVDTAIEVAREALASLEAQAAQGEAVAWINGRRDVLLNHPEQYGRADEDWQPLYTHPQQSPSEARDAERYRWLISRPLDGGDTIYISCDDDNVWAIGGDMDKASADALIDAAMQAQKGGE